MCSKKGNLLNALVICSICFLLVGSIFLGNSQSSERVPTITASQQADLERLNVAVNADLVSAIVGPGQNIDFMAAYDSAEDKIIIYGGWNVTPDTANKGETWAYDVDTDTFVNMKPAVAPSPRFLSSIEYDSQSDRTVLFGGYQGQIPAFTFDETWIYDYNANAWSQGSPTTSPGRRYGFQLVYDSESDRIILFGGYKPGAGGYSGDTWAYDVETDTWVEMKPTV
ncbi:MAG: Kelch repeat-containing protein, partial [Candidatus Thorarchaeota archaeon]